MDWAQQACRNCNVLPRRLNACVNTCNRKLEEAVFAMLKSSLRSAGLGAGLGNSRRDRLLGHDRGGSCHKANLSIRARTPHTVWECMISVGCTFITVCLYVCMYVCMYVRMYACAYACMCLYTYMYIKYIHMLSGTCLLISSHRTPCVVVLLQQVADASSGAVAADCGYAHVAFRTANGQARPARRSDASHALIGQRASYVLCFRRSSPWVPTTVASLGTALLRPLRSRRLPIISDYHEGVLQCSGCVRGLRCIVICALKNTLVTVHF